MKSALPIALLAGCLALAGCSKKQSQSNEPGSNPAADKLAVVDLTRFYREPLGGDMASIAGRQTIDGLVFYIDGRITIYGQSQVSWDNRGNSSGNNDNGGYPDSRGISVGRTFDEIHLVHATYWPDVEGETIALIRLDYADGTQAELPILYGGHVRDCQRIRTEEKELLTDPNSKVIWRGEGVASFKSTQRLFKSMLLNPHPQKAVASLDVISSRRLAAYSLLAITTADRDPNRPATPAAPDDDPERHFDDKVTIQVVDDSGTPVAHALVQPYMNVDGPGMVAAPFYTDATGKGEIRYPKDRTSRMSLSASSEGYRRAHAGWSGTFPTTATLKLEREP